MSEKYCTCCGKLKEKEHFPKIKKYCGGCGELLIVKKVLAENYDNVFGHPFPLISKNYTRHNRNTGKRQYLLEYKCPNMRWWENKYESDHDMFTEEIEGDYT